MTDPVKLHGIAADGFDRRVAAVGADQWAAPTPCAEWDVRELVNHLVYEAKWAPELFAGKTIEEVGDRYDGDQLGDDPVGVWRDSNADARTAISDPGALERTVHLSFGDVPAGEYLNQLTLDLAVHGWDLARAIGADETIEPALVDALLPYIEANAELISGSGVFGDPVQVSPDADPQTRLLALLGRSS
jgi:uncharacterized protein (TIGR03086 family)